MEVADDAEADGVLALIRWLEAAPEAFIVSSRPGADDQPITSHAPGLLLPAESGYVRVDMDRVSAADGTGQTAGGRTRTTIQRLVQAALRSGQPVAAFTRLSEV